LEGECDSNGRMHLPCEISDERVKDD
jgi:hypothetical protein